MKKTLLILSLATLAFGASAQVEGVDPTSGFADYFSTSTVPDKLTYFGDNEQFGLEDARTGNGSLDLILTKDSSNAIESNAWYTMGFVTEGTIDISLNQIIEASFTNNGDKDIEVYFDFVSNETVGPDIELISGNVEGAPFGGFITAGSTVVFTFDLVGAKKRTWVADQAACDALEGPEGVLLGNSCMQDYEFDPANLSKLEFAIVGAASAETSWAQPALNDHSVSINYITGGAKVVGLFSVAQEASFEVFPNPANKEIVGFSKDLNNVVIMNALGSVVFETASASDLNVSSFDTGVYILKSDQGSTKLIIE